MQFDPWKGDRMDKKVKKIWVKALRSGEYNQAQGKLRQSAGKHSGYCCLGVLCDVLEPKGWKKRTFDGVTMWEHRKKGIKGIGIYLPVVELREKVKLSDEAVENLISMNDSGVTFKRIAAYIEKKL